VVQRFLTEMLQPPVRKRANTELHEMKHDYARAFSGIYFCDLLLLGLRRHSDKARITEQHDFIEHVPIRAFRSIRRSVRQSVRRLRRSAVLNRILHLFFSLSLVSPCSTKISITSRFFRRFQPMRSARLHRKNLYDKTFREFRSLSNRK